MISWPFDPSFRPSLGIGSALFSSSATGSGIRLPGILGPGLSKNSVQGHAATFQASIHDEDHPERPLIGCGNWQLMSAVCASPKLCPSVKSTVCTVSSTRTFAMNVAYVPLPPAVAGLASPLLAAS